MAPTRTLADAGLTLIELNTAVQVMTVFPAIEVAGSVAVMVLVPPCKQSTSLVTDSAPSWAFVVLELAQVELLVKS